MKTWNLSKARNVCHHMEKARNMCFPSSVYIWKKLNYSNIGRILPYLLSSIYFAKSLEDKL